MKILRDLSLAIRFLTIFPIASFPFSNNSNQDEEEDLEENFERIYREARSIFKK